MNDAVVYTLPNRLCRPWKFGNSLFLLRLYFLDDLLCGDLIYQQSHSSSCLSPNTYNFILICNCIIRYTSKMLLAAIDERHRGTYDFIYLPIDFKASLTLLWKLLPCNWMTCCFDPFIILFVAEQMQCRICIYKHD